MRLLGGHGLRWPNYTTAEGEYLCHIYCLYIFLYIPFSVKNIVLSSPVQIFLVRYFIAPTATHSVYPLQWLGKKNPYFLIHNKQSLFLLGFSYLFWKGGRCKLNGNFSHLKSWREMGACYIYKITDFPNRNSVITDRRRRGISIRIYTLVDHRPGKFYLINVFLSRFLPLYDLSWKVVK